MDEQSFGVCIIHYRDRSAVETLLAETRTWSQPPALSVVVDNSGDLPASIAQRPGVQVAVPGSNVGYGAAVNIGVARLSAAGLPFALLLTQDAHLEPDTAQRLLDDLRDDPALGVAAPLLALRSRPDTIFSAGGRFGRWGLPRHLFPGDPIAAHRKEGHLPVAWADGACLMVRTKDFEAVGGIPEEYFLYVEEVDFLDRIARAGRKVQVNLRALAYQEPGNFTPYLRSRNTLYFIRRGHQAHRTLRTAQFIAVELATALRSRRPANLAWSVRGLVDAFRRRMGQPPARLLHR